MFAGVPEESTAVKSGFHAYTATMQTGYGVAAGRQGEECCMASRARREKRASGTVQCMFIQPVHIAALLDPLSLV